jgi:hypothetical protein
MLWDFSLVFIAIFVMSNVYCRVLDIKSVEFPKNIFSTSPYTPSGKKECRKSHLFSKEFLSIAITLRIHFGLRIYESRLLWLYRIFFQFHWWSYLKGYKVKSKFCFLRFHWVYVWYFSIGFVHQEYRSDNWRKIEHHNKKRRKQRMDPQSFFSL